MVPHTRIESRKGDGTSFLTGKGTLLLTWWSVRVCVRVCARARVCRVSVHVAE